MNVDIDQYTAAQRKLWTHAEDKRLTEEQLPWVVTAEAVAKVCKTSSDTRNKVLANLFKDNAQNAQSDLVCRIRVDHNATTEQPTEDVIAKLILIRKAVAGSDDSGIILSSADGLQWDLVKDLTVTKISDAATYFAHCTNKPVAEIMQSWVIEGAVHMFSPAVNNVLRRTMFT